jgi:hypothetical protein
MGALLQACRGKTHLHEQPWFVLLNILKLSGNFSILYKIVRLNAFHVLLHRLSGSPLMKVDRNKAKLKKMSDADDPFVDMPSRDCIDIMWELTVDLWSLRQSPYVEQRLPRHIARLARQ